MSSTSSASENPQESPDDAPRRSWQIYGLLALAALALIALPAALVGKRLYEARQLERIATAGGCIVQWGWKHHDKWYDSPTMRRIAGNANIGFHESPPSGTPDADEQWLAVSRQLRPYAHRVHGIDFSQSAVSGRGLDDLAAYPGLVTLCLASTNLTDADLDILAELPRIEYLFLNNGVFTDASLDRLSRLPKLTMLYVDGAQLTPDGIDALSHLSQLQQLFVGGAVDAGPSRTDLATSNSSLQIVDRRTGHSGGEQNSPPAPTPRSQTPPESPAR
jgi:hypothetical protein